MSNIDNLCNYIVKRNIQSEVDVRAYLKRRINDESLIDDVVDKLVERKIIIREVEVEDEVDTPEVKPKETPKNDFIIPAYKRAIAQIFQKSLPLPRSKLKMKLSFDLNWFSPDDSAMFISFCERDGLIEEKDGLIHPTFDASSVEIPRGWSIHEELNIKTGKELAEERLDKIRANKEVAFVRQEKQVEVKAMLEEDGIVIDEDMISGTPIDFDDIEEDMTVSKRMDFKRRIIKKIAKFGLPSRSANGMFDYYELNYDIANVDMFIMAAVQNEGFTNEGALRKIFDALKEEDWGWQNET